MTYTEPTRNRNNYMALWWLGQTMESLHADNRRYLHEEPQYRHKQIGVACLMFRFVAEFSSYDPDLFDEFIDNVEEYVHYTYEYLCEHRCLPPGTFELIEGTDESGQWWTITIEDRAIHRTNEYEMGVDLCNFLNKNFPIIK